MEAEHVSFEKGEGLKRVNFCLIQCYFRGELCISGLFFPNTHIRVYFPTHIFNTVG